MRASRHAAIILLAALCLAGRPAAGDDLKLRSFSTRRYEIKTNLSRAEAAVFGRHMDAVYAEYARRFRRFGATADERMPLFLLRTSAQYHAFLEGHGIAAPNTNGVFFVQEELRGLATWTHDRPRSQTFAVLQHEGFHQFAHTHIGSRLPLWVNEGLAQYFEDGIFVRRRLVLGQRNERRILAVRNALRRGTAIDFERMLGMGATQWQATVAGGGLTASLMYDQAWSMVYYLVRTGERRQEAFLQYLERLGRQEDPVAAFRSVFGNNTMAFRRAWERFALAARPDMLNTAVGRIEFLGQGLRRLHERGERMPRTFRELQSELKRVRFRMRVHAPGLVLAYDAADDENYRFRRPNGTVGNFVVRPSTDPALPPTITAEGLNPTPSLVWFRDDEGDLASEVRYR